MMRCRINQLILIVLTTIILTIVLSPKHCYSAYLGKGWREESITTNLKYSLPCRVDVNVLQEPSILFVNNKFKFELAQKLSAKWVFSELEKASKSFSSAMKSDNKGGLHIVYNSTDSSKALLRYSSKTDAKRIDEIIDSESYITGSQPIDIDLNNQPHVIYYRNSDSNKKGMIRNAIYAFKDKNGWHRDTIDASNAYINGCIKLNKSQLPYFVFYNTKNKFIVLAKSKNTIFAKYNKWTFSNIVRCLEIPSLKLAFDTTGNLSVSYYTNNKINTIKLVGNRWMVVKELNMSFTNSYIITNNKNKSFILHTLPIINEDQDQLLFTFPYDYLKREVWNTALVKVLDTCRIKRYYDFVLDINENPCICFIDEKTHTLQYFTFVKYNK